MRRFLIVSLIAFSAASLLSSRAEAGPVLVSDLTSSQDDYWYINAGYAGFGEFTLSGAANISSANLLLGIEGTASNFEVSIVNDNSGSPGSTVLGTSLASSGAIGAGYSQFSFSFTSPVSLGSGTYWLELFTSSGDSTAWGSSDTSNIVNTGSDGSVLSTLDYNQLQHQISTEGYIFSLSGSLGSAVPEPATVSLLGMGIAVMAGCEWRRRKQSRKA